MITFLVIVTIPTSSAFQVIVYPVFCVNSAAKIFDFNQGVTLLDVVTRGGPPPSDATGVYAPMSDLATGNSSKYTAQLPQ